MDNDLPATTDASVDVNPMAEGKCAEIKKDLKADLDKALEAGATPQFIRFILSCVSGLPGIGPVVGASSNFWGEQDQSKFNQILGAWLKMHEHEIDEIGKTMAEVAMRIDLNDEKVEARVRSPEYLSLVRKCFRDWAAAESEERRTLIRNLLVNAAACEICKDDVVKMFIGWIDHYTEPHFKVISTVYRLTNPTRQDIWLEINGQQFREDSAEADMFKLLVHDLSVGRIMRQHRDKDYNGNYLKVNPQRRPKASGPKTMTSAFDDGKEYELTELGQQFVHYTMTDIVRKISYEAP